MSKTFPATKKLLGEIRFSYATVFQPASINNSPDLKYSVVLIWKKTDAKTTQAVNAAIEAAREQGKDKLWKGKLPPNLKTTVHDGDVDRPDDDVVKGCYFLNCTSKEKPGVMVRENGNSRPASGVDEFYSGCYGYATVNFYPYDQKGNRGVGAGIQNLLKTRDGERLGGRASAEEDFADFTDVDDNESIL